MKRAKAVSDKNYTIDRVDERMTGSFVEHLGRCMYGGLYEPSHIRADQSGFRNDVKQLIREAGISVIRYPGGNFVSGYDWKDGIGPKEERPRRMELAWNVVETNEVGTNEFAAFLKELDIDMIMSVNLGTGTPKEAGELVEYCNKAGGTYWSDLRKAHGVLEPHNFKMWCLGNEMDGEWQICMHTPEEYARLLKETCKIVKWMEPEAQIIACGSCTNEKGHRTYGEWDRVVLEEAYDYIDYLSLHRYYNYDPSKQVFYPSEENRTDIPYIFCDLRNYLDTVISACDFVKGKKHSEKTVGISFDEWGVVTESSAIPGGASQSYNYASFKMLDALIYGGILCVFLNYADRVKIACQSLLVNEGGMITTDPSGRAIRQATFYPFQDVAKYGRGTALRISSNLPSRKTDHHGMQNSLELAGVYNDADQEVVIFAANFEMEEEVELELELLCFGKLQGITWRELYHENPDARNTFDDEFCVVPIEKELPDPVNGKVKLVLKEHSWNVLRFSCINKKTI